LDQLFVTFARMAEPLVCLLGPSETHFSTVPRGGPHDSVRSDLWGACYFGCACFFQAGIELLAHCTTKSLFGSSAQKLTFSPQAVFWWATESRKRPPLLPTARFASHKFVLALDQLFVTFAHMSEPLVCLLGPSETLSYSGRTQKRGHYIKSL
jgi:hypothetical protein